MECGICMIPYDALQRRPKCLPCGHTFCLECLQDNSFKQMCPLDRKVISSQIAELPDNFQLLALLDDPLPNKPAASTAPRRWWCKTCSKEAPDSCLDADHDVCSLRKVRSLQVEADLKGLQQKQVSLQELEKVMNQVEEDNLTSWLPQLQSEVGELRAQLQQLRAAQKKVEEALDGPSGAWEVARQDAVQQAKLISSFLESLSLMQDSSLSCTLTVTRGSHSSTATWKLDQLAQSDAPLNRQLRYLIHHLQKQKKLPVVPGKSATAENPSTSSLDMRALSSCGLCQKVEEKSALLASGFLEEVRTICGLRCDRDPHWVLQLLNETKKVEELSLTGVQSKHHLIALSRLHYLRRLNVKEDSSCKIESEVNFPRFEGRPVYDDYSYLPLRYVDGLNFLSVQLSQTATILSLCCACAYSLEELEIGECSFTAELFEKPNQSNRWNNVYHLREDVGKRLNGCGLLKLKKLVFRWVNQHSTNRCCQQRNKIWEYMPKVKVLCSICDEV